MPQKQSTYEASPTQATTRATGNWGGEGGEKSMAGAPRMGGAMGGLFGGLLGGSRSANVTPNSVKGLMPQGGGGLLGGLFGAGRYTGIRDMFNGGGPGRSGEQFYGGGAMSAALNRAGVRPSGYSGLMAQMASQAAQKAAQPGYTPTGYGAAPAGGSGGVGGVSGGGVGGVGGVGGGTGPSVTSPTGALPPMPVSYPGNAYVPVQQYMTVPQAAALTRLPFGAGPPGLFGAGVGSPISAEEAAFLNLISTQSPLAQSSYTGNYIQPPAVPRAGGPYAGPVAQAGVGQSGAPGSALSPTGYGPLRISNGMPMSVVQAQAVNRGIGYNYYRPGWTITPSYNNSLNLRTYTQSPVSQGSYTGNYIQPPAVPRAGGPYAGPVAQAGAAPQAAAAPSATAGLTGPAAVAASQAGYAEMLARIEAQAREEAAARAEAERRAREQYQGMMVAP